VRPISQTAAYLYRDIDEYDKVEAGIVDGYTYARDGTESTSDLEAAMAELEGAASGVACASGTAAVVVALLSVLQPGQHVLVSKEVFGGIHVVLREEFSRLGFGLCIIDLADLGELERMLSERPIGAVFCESVSNPLLRVEDLDGVAAVAKRHGIALVVDNTFATPCLCRPLDHGADLVVHSASKFLNGHSDVVAGIVLGSNDQIARVRRTVTRFGANLGSFEAWLVLRGLRTLCLRMERAGQNAANIAERLATTAGVTRVYYPDAAGRRRLSQIECHLGGRVGLVSFEMAGGRDAAATLVRRLNLIPFVGSLGDVTTTISHPFTTTHRRLPDDIKRGAGISDSLLRLSVGIEALEDLLEDLEQAMATGASRD
jgi:cystathionine beta-lyase/cystathionine gamma-synthase